MQKPHQNHKTLRFPKKILTVLIILSFPFSYSPQKAFAATCTNDTYGTCSGGDVCVWITPSSSDGTVGRYQCSGSTACSVCTENQLCKLWVMPGTTNIVNRECIDLTCPTTCSGSEECVCDYGGCSCQEGEVGTPSPGESIPEGAELGTGFDISKLVKNIYNILLPLAVVISFLLIGRAGYMIMTSQGDPRRVMESKENLTSAIMGLLFVLLSVGILRVILSTLITGENPGF